MWIILGILALLLFLAVLAYNTVVARKNNVENAFGAVEAELKKRRDLIPNLVEAVKAYRDYERELLERLVALRERAAKAGSPEEELKAEGEIGRLLPRLLARLEAYPDLKASANFLQLQAALTEVEDSIAAARR
ncbi:LemA family protein, partial [Thermus sp.]|uniref:LemA family protein n=1 Tax=Thermus sp. TaxID=275 RepID=UPI00307E451D